MKWIYRLRGWLMVPPMIFLTFCTWAETEKEVLVWGLGGAVFTAGVGMRLWAQRHLRYRLPVKKILTDSGPYAIIRNPIYVGNAAILVGACFLGELFWFAPVMLLYVGIVYSQVVRYEESHLLAKYGLDYDGYLQRVPRWFPRDIFPVGSTATLSVASSWDAFRVEAYNLLLLAPFIIKEVLD